MNAQQFLINEFLDLNCEDITTNPNPDYSQPFYQSIIRLMEKYAAYHSSDIYDTQQATKDYANSWKEQFKEAIQEVKSLQAELDDAKYIIRDLEYELRSK